MRSPTDLTPADRELLARVGRCRRQVRRLGRYRNSGACRCAACGKGVLRWRLIPGGVEMECSDPACIHVED
jgi:hypothetical protein